MPEHVRHTNTPKFTDAHVGGDRPSQSAHCRLSGCLSSSPSFFCCALICEPVISVAPPGFDSASRGRSVPAGRARGSPAAHRPSTAHQHVLLSRSQATCGLLRGDNACDVVLVSDVHNAPFVERWPRGGNLPFAGLL
jgi:hypothetical protein